MKKNLLFLKFKFLNAIQFRGEILLWIILDFVPFLVLFLVLKTMYQTSDEIYGYNLDQIVFYYLVVAFITGVSSTHFEGWRVEEIKMGKIDYFLTRPFSYLKEIALQEIAGKLFYFIVFLPIYIGMFMLTDQLTGVQFPEISVLSFFTFLLLLIFAFILELFIGIGIVLIGFWFEGSQGLEHFKWFTITLFSGSLVPLEFLPTCLRSISEFLPLKYMYAVPLEVLNSRYTLSIEDVFIVSGTVLFFTLTIAFIWKRAQFQYSSSGG